MIKKLDAESRIIFVSGDESVKAEALAAGADLFLVKPVRIKELTESIEKIVKAPP